MKTTHLTFLLASIAVITLTTQLAHAKRFAIVEPALPIIVNSNTDTTTTDGFCTLREGIENVNDNAVTHSDCPTTRGKFGNFIQFDPSLFGETITLAGSELIIRNDLSILGPGPDRPADLTSFPWPTFQHTKPEKAKSF